ncbi:hypothetical protein C8Q72DRAFT_857810 [Fomitopsis betulina]|nr:hypothetical protein C8Q72DRAFT_857810 [Fomitopsis betulina]
MPYHHLSRIDNAGILLGIIGGLLGGYSSWRTYFVHHYRLREAKSQEISQTVNALTADDKAVIDTYIAQVAAINPQHTECLLDTQRMLNNLAEVQRQHAEVDETLAASPRFNFPWSDVAHSIDVLLTQCRQLHRPVSQTTAQGLEHRHQVSTPTISSFIQQSPAASSFIQEPPNSYAGSHHTRGP